jgi:hypothetical protein
MAALPQIPAIAANASSCRMQSWSSVSIRKAYIPEPPPS